jgi:purine-binding chemotaxis protein CheW
MADLVKRGGHAPQKRARQLDRGPRTEYLAFVLGSDVYAAPVALIREILKPPPLTPVPRAPFSIMGIVSVRGQLVTVVDLRRRLRLAEGPTTRKTRILLSDSPSGETLGLHVDEVLQVYRLAEAEIEHATTALGGDVAGYISGIARPARGLGGAMRSGDPRRLYAPGSRGAIEEVVRGSAAPEPDASVVILLDLKAILTF